MQKWEYWAVAIDKSDMGKALDEAGKQGWELAHGEWKVDNRDNGDYFDVFLAVFKRPLAEHGASNIGQVMPEKVSTPEPRNVPTGPYVLFHFDAVKGANGGYAPDNIDRVFPLADLMPQHPDGWSILLACLNACSVVETSISRELQEATARKAGDA